jgi:hypothetical protein
MILAVMADRFTPFINLSFHLSTTRAFGSTGVGAASDNYVRIVGGVSGQDVTMQLPYASSLPSNDLYFNRMELLEMGNLVFLLTSAESVDFVG